MLPAGRLLRLAAVALPAAALAACASKGSTALNTAKVEQAIAASILSEHHLQAAVTCPAPEAAQAGRTFTCVASLGAGEYPVTVTETDASGHVRYANAAPLATLDIDRVEAAIRRSVLRQRGVRTTVRCPTEVLQQQGLAFTCTASARGRRYAFTVSELDGTGRVRYSGG